jgi:hypothetical protein
VLVQHTVPALRKLMPALPPDAILTAPGP